MNWKCLWVGRKKKPRLALNLQWQIYWHRILFAHLSAAYLLILCAITFFAQLLWVWCSTQSFWSRIEAAQHINRFSVWKKWFILCVLLELSGSSLHLWELNYKNANSSEGTSTRTIFHPPKLYASTLVECNKLFSTLNSMPLIRFP